MNKQIVAATLVFVASVFSLPAYAAGPLSGVCTFTGTATFKDASNNPTNITTTPQQLKFDFTTDPGGTCSGLYGTTLLTQVASSATAGGSGLLSCSASVSGGNLMGSGSGSGSITAGTNPAVAFDLALVGTGTEVTFVLTGKSGGVGSGQATFVLSIVPASACATTGVASLNFTLVAKATALSSP